MLTVIKSLNWKLKQHSWGVNSPVILILVQPGLKWVFHPTSSGPPHGQASKTTGYTMVRTSQLLSLRKGAPEPHG